MIVEDKPTLARLRAELVESLTRPLPAPERVRIQGELSVINAKIKALNTTEAAANKAAADRRRVAGLAEARANTTRALARAGGNPVIVDADLDNSDPGPADVIEGWIDAVLLRHDVDFTRANGGDLVLVGPAKWTAVIGALVEGLRASARAKALPELSPSVLEPVTAAIAGKHALTPAEIQAGAVERKQAEQRTKTSKSKPRKS
jgi:hypothetical protein